MHVIMRTDNRLYRHIKIQLIITLHRTGFCPPPTPLPPVKVPICLKMSENHAGNQGRPKIQKFSGGEPQDLPKGVYFATFSFLPS